MNNNLLVASMNGRKCLKGISGSGNSLRYNFRQPVIILISAHSGPLKLTNGSNI